MKYLADILTFTRILLSPVVLVLLIYKMWSAAMVAIMVAIISDALDGIAARKWPYSAHDNWTLWWRRNISLDSIADRSFSLACLVGLTLSSSILWLVLLLVAWIEREVATKLAKKNGFEVIDFIHRWLYGILLFVMLTTISIYALGHWQIVSGIYLISAIVVIIIKKDRAIPSKRYLK